MDARILRNAGGLATNDMLRSLVLSQRRMQTRDILPSALAGVRFNPGNIRLDPGIHAAAAANAQAAADQLSRAIEWKGDAAISICRSC